jgi:hypothetical protein
MQAQLPDPLNPTPSALLSSFPTLHLHMGPLQNQSISQAKPQPPPYLSIMSQVVQPTPMPAQGHHSAPKFNGLTEELERFLSDLKCHMLHTSLSNQEKIEYALQYVSIEVSHLWGWFSYHGNPTVQNAYDSQ